MQPVKVVGLDVSRGKVTACVLETIPADLLEFARSYKPKVFKSTTTELEQLASLGDVYILEPTGTDHRVFSEFLRQKEKVVLGCTGTRVRNYAKDNGLLNKADREDAAVIAAFTLRHLQANNPKAFISLDACAIKERFQSLKNLRKQRVALINTLRSRLTFEMPELHDKKASDRQWCNPRPPQLWRAIAGEDNLHQGGVQLPEQTAGRGLSELSRQLAAQICTLERIEFGMESECDNILSQPDYEIYRKVFSRWKIAPATQIAIISAIYPIEQFLSDDGDLVRRRVYATERSKHTKTVRDRSLKQFKRALGAGRQWIQSGKKEFWAKTGDPSVRGSLFAFLERIVVVRRQPTVTRLASMFPELEAKLEKTPARKIKTLIQSQYSLPALLEYWQAGQPVKEPWKDARLIERTANFTQVSPKLAALQLFYEMAPQCQGKCKTERLMKVYPRFVEWLFRDLVAEYKATLSLRNSDRVSNERRNTKTYPVPGESQVMSTVLIVDDSSTLREMIAGLLINAGMNVVEARDGVEAKEMIETNPPDLVVLDIVMPHMNGYELCRWIKNTPNTQTIPVVICSSKSEEFDRYWGMKQGADAYIAKPFRPNDMIDTVKQLLRGQK